MQVLTGNDVMIGGFVIGGSANKTVAIVATGPSLAAFGITNPLANPTLTLVRSSDQAVIATNDNWQAARNAAQLQAAGFAPTQPARGGDPRQPAAGRLHGDRAGRGRRHGRGGDRRLRGRPAARPARQHLDARQGAHRQRRDDRRLRHPGHGPQTVAIVATGPSLAAFGITSPLANPTITLVRSSDQAVIATNDDWAAARTPRRSRRRLRADEPARVGDPRHAAAGRLHGDSLGGFGRDGSGRPGGVRRAVGVHP